MQLDLRKAPHILFFGILLPVISFKLSQLFYQQIPNPPYWLETLSPLYAYGILFALFNNYAWHWQIFRILKIVTVPDLRGRWNGSVRSFYKKNGVNVQVPLKLEIKQNFSSIVVRAFFEKSDSESISANFTSLNDEVYLYYTYDNDPNSFKEGTMQKHKGTTKLKYIKNGKQLVGSYFNSIKNAGDLTVIYESNKLLNHF